MPAHDTQPAALLYCRCAYAQVVPQSVKDGVLEKLCESGASFETVADLCEMAAHRDPRLQALAARPRLRIAACYPRVVHGLFQQCGAVLPQESTEILNMRTLTADEIAAAMLGEAPPPSSIPPSSGESSTAPLHPGQWPQDGLPAASH